MALNAPTDPRVCVGCTQYEDGECRGEGYVALCWEWSGGEGEIKQFKLLFRIAGDDTWTARYPDKNPPNPAEPEKFQYNLMGLSGTPNDAYEWRIKAEAQNPENDSQFVEGVSFSLRESLVNGGNGVNGGSVIDLINPLAADTLEDAINAFINFLFYLAMAAAPILIIYAGFLLLTAGGDPAKITRARQIITWTLVAVAIILFAKGLPALIKGAFGG